MNTGAGGTGRDSNQFVSVIAPANALRALVRKSPALSAGVVAELRNIRICAFCMVLTQRAIVSLHTFSCYVFILHSHYVRTQFLYIIERIFKMRKILSKSQICVL